MTKATANAVSLMVVSLVLLNCYRLGPFVPGGDTVRGVFVLVTTTAGLGCLIVGALRLLRSASGRDDAR